MYKNELDRFESFIKGKADELEFEYNPADWSALEQKLPKASPQGLTNTGKFWLGAASVGLILTAATVYFVNMPSEVENNTLSQQEVTVVSVEEPTKTVTETAQPEEETLVHAPENINEENITPERVEVLPTVNPPEVSTASQPLPREKVVPDVTEATSRTIPPAKASLEILPFHQQFCVGEVIEIEGKASGKITWLMDDKQLSTGETAKIEDLKPGKYSVTAKVGDTYQTKTFEVIEPPTALPVHVSKEYVRGWPIHQFRINEFSGNKVTWKINGENLPSSNGMELNHTFLKAGQYEVIAEVTNLAGCTTTSKEYVRISNEEILLAPLAFTCNDDNLNERYIPESLKHLEEDFTFEIYSKINGALVYKAVNDRAGWDGVDYSSGQICKTGEYTWKVVVKTTDGQLQFAGNLLLFR